MLCTSSSTRKKLQKEEMWSYFPIATKKEIKVNFLYGCCVNNTIRICGQMLNLRHVEFIICYIYTPMYTVMKVLIDV